MSDLEREARQFASETKAKLKEHDTKFANQYTATEELIDRVAKLEAKVAALTAKEKP